MSNPADPHIGDIRPGYTLKFFGGPSDGRVIKYNGNLPDVFVLQHNTGEEDMRAYDYEREPGTSNYHYKHESIRHLDESLEGEDDG